MQQVGNVSEWRSPNYDYLVQAVPPIGMFWAMFAAIAYIMQTYEPYNSPENYRRFRIRNLSVCLLHSLLSGGTSLALIVMYPYIVQGDNMLYYTSPALLLMLQMCIGYFIHDTVHMVLNDRSKAVGELVVHHVLCMFVFVIALGYRQFLPFAAVSLLMEVNSVFLHWRSLNNLKGYAITSFYCRTVRAINVATIFVFRFGSQAWMVAWLVLSAPSHLHIFYTSIGWTGSAIFLVFNGHILWRLLRSDGYIGARADCSFDRGVPAKPSNGTTGGTHQDSNGMKNGYEQNGNHALNGINLNTNGVTEPRRRHV